VQLQTRERDPKERCNVENDPGAPPRDQDDTSSRAREQREVDAATDEAARVGGEPDRDTPASRRPVVEGGGGESEGFELAEELLVEHASHADEQSAHAVLHHEGLPESQSPGYADGEADQEMKDGEDGDGADAGEPRDEQS
jgi:hypothetical protein